MARRKKITASYWTSKQWHTRIGRKAASQLGRSLYRRQLRLEPLEDRRLLALVTVTTLEDSVNFSDGVTSLREAIFATNTVPGADTIEFAPLLTAGGPATILLTLGELAIIDSLAINGPGAELLTIDASGNDPTPELNDGDGSRLFRIDDGSNQTRADVTILGLDLTGGDASGDGGAVSSRENLAVVSSSIVGNSAQQNGGGLWVGFNTGISMENSLVRGNYAGNFGGGVNAYGSSSASIERTAILNNTAAGAAGGGVFFVAGNAFESTLRISGSTVSGNRTSSVAGPAQTGGGGIYSTGDVIVNQSTISGNLAVRGGGIFGRNRVFLYYSTVTENVAVHDGGGVTSSTVAVDYTIIAGNTADQQSPDVRPFGRLYANHSLVGTAATGVVEAPINAPDEFGNIVGGPVHGAVNPLLGPLADNGGPTMAHALLAGSPAINFDRRH
jgi:hypothetical protein